ncbi:MAG: hypothetical protein HKN26_09035 [Acidimicrobiales bacterium]|nr:hypothetical protein [Acidimicrobiales bacterium]
MRTLSFGFGAFRPGALGFAGLGAVMVLGGCTSTTAPGATSTTPATAPEPVAGAAPAAVVNVIDGDSANLEIGGAEIEVRIRGINAIERFDCGGDAATEALTLLLAGDNLKVTGDETDRFGRLLVDVRAGEVNVAERMVALGWALGSHGDGRYVAAMRQAAETGAGFWALDCDPTFVGELDIGVVAFDPDGNDRDNLAEEYVEIVNPTTAPLSHEGWTLRDETTGHHFTLPAGTIEPGGSYLVRSGTGQSDAENLYLEESFPVWSNQGETVLLLDPSGTLVAARFLEPS